MKLTKKSETNSKITFTYDKPPGVVEGYLYFADGVRVSRTFNPNDLEVTFGKVSSGKYAVEAVGFNTIARAEWPEVVTPPDPPLPMDWVHDYTAARGQATPTDYGWSWGVQYGGTISPGGAANTLQLVPDGIRPGIPSARLTVSPDPGNDAVEGLYKWPVKIGDHKFYGQMVKFPTDWQEPSPAKWGACLNQFGYQALVNATQSLIAHADSCMYVLLTGEQRWPDPSKPGIGSPIREFDNMLGEWPVYPTVIKPPMRLGVWHQLIFEIKWSTCSTRSAHYADIGVAGHIRVWHKHMGDATWTKTYEQLDIPTLQWGYGYDWDGSGSATPVFWPVNSNGFTASHKFGLYAGGASFPRVVEHGNIGQGPSFASVERQLGL